MFGMQAMGSRLWDAREAMFHLAKDAVAEDTSKSATSESNMRTLASLKKQDIITLAFVAEIIAFGLVALSFYGCCSTPDTWVYIAPALLLAMITAAAATAAIAIPFGAKHLLQKRAEALSD